MPAQPAAGGAGASSEMNPHDLCVPSQNGRLADCPQRQRAIAGLLAGISNSAPRESTSLNGPSTTRGPLARRRIVTSAMNEDSKNSSERGAGSGEREANNESLRLSAPSSLLPALQRLLFCRVFRPHTRRSSAIGADYEKNSQLVVVTATFVRRHFGGCLAVSQPN